MSKSLEGRITAVLPSGNFFVYTEPENGVGRSFSAYRTDNPCIVNPHCGMRVSFQLQDGLAIGACSAEGCGPQTADKVRHAIPAR